MPATTLSRGNLLIDTYFAITVTPPASIVTTALTAGTYTVPGLIVGDLVQPYFTTAITTYSMVYAIVTAANTMVIYFSSETGSTVSSAAAVLIAVNWQRPEPGSFALMPTSAQ